MHTDLGPIPTVQRADKALDIGALCLTVKTRWVDPRRRGTWRLDRITARDLELFGMPTITGVASGRVITLRSATWLRDKSWSEQLSDPVTFAVSMNRDIMTASMFGEWERRGRPVFRSWSTMLEFAELFTYEEAA